MASQGNPANNIPAPDWMTYRKVNEDGTVTVYEPLVLEGMSIKEAEQDLDLRIDPKPIKVKADDFNHGHPVYRVTGKPEVIDRHFEK